MRSDTTMRPVVFGGCVGWLHPSKRGGETTSLGVVLCSALGRDARCLYRPMRILADQLAAAGVATLRFDYPGEGDSADLPMDADALPEWLSAIEKAKDLLRAETGVTHIGIGGARLGGTLAALAAQDCALLLMLAPIVDGKGWINKLQFVARHRKGAPGAGSVAAQIDADGLTLSASTIKSLSSINLTKLPFTPPKVIVASNGLSTKVLEQHLSDLGASVIKFPFDGQDEVFLDPNANEPPQALFSSIRQWLEDNAHAHTVGGAGGGPKASAPLKATLDLPGARETPLIFGPALCGVLCEPASPRAGGKAVIFFNTGGDPRAGIGRFAVNASRELARLGVLSLRFDFAGVGDSPTDDLVDRTHVYETSRAQDIDAALGLLHARGCDQIFVVGISAGAYHALHTVLNDPRIAGAFCVSPLKLVWRPGDSLAIGERAWGKASVAYLDQIRQWRTWSRALQGQVNVMMVLKTLTSRLLARLSPRVDSVESQALRAAMKLASARGAQICMIMGIEDASLDEIEVHFGRGAGQLKRLANTSLVVIPHIDHGLVYYASREVVLGELLSWLGFDPKDERRLA